MAPRAPASRAALATSFIRAAQRYWLSVFPRTRAEVRHWRRRAEQIPDPTLRRHAREAQEIKSGNIEGSTAFAAFVSGRNRPAVVRAQVAFQSAYDYLDTLAEQPCAEPARNASQLHQALLVATNPDVSCLDYYSLSARQNDAGYLMELVQTCRDALTTLPSYCAAAPSIHRLTERIVAYQSLNLTEQQGGQGGLARWAKAETPRGSGLAWWETAASAGSSLGAFALMAAAAHPSLRPEDALAIERAYWPWVGALHSLLDSLVDLNEDAAAGQRSLLDYYESPQETAWRLQALVERAFSSVQYLPRAHEHLTVIVAMISFYLVGHEPRSATGRLANVRVRDALGPLGIPSMATFRARRALAACARR